MNSPKLSTSGYADTKLKNQTVTGTQTLAPQAPSSLDPLMATTS